MIEPLKTLLTELISSADMTTEIEQGDLPYKEIDAERQSKPGLFSFLAQDNLSLEDSLSVMVVQSWWWNVYVHAGAERNARAWDYWSKVQSGVQSKLSYKVYAHFDGTAPNRYTLSGTSLSADNPNFPGGGGSSAGIQIDISDRHVFYANNVNPYTVIKADKSGNKKGESAKFGTYSGTENGTAVNHLTYGPDNFLYVCTNDQAVRKFDPIAMYEVKKYASLSSSATYLNYDYNGKLFVCTGSKTVKLDAQTMSKDGEIGSGSGDVAINETHIAVYNGTSVELWDKNDFSKTSPSGTYSFANSTSNPSLAFVSKTELVAFGKDSTPQNKLAKIDVSNPSSPTEVTATTSSLPSMPKKIVPAPDGSFFIGFASSGETHHRNADLTLNASATATGTVAGLVVDVE